MQDIPLFKVHMPQSVKTPLLDTLFSGFIGQGPKVEEFEECLGEYFDNNNVITVNSGTSSLQLALRLANVGSGDEVISTPMTCTATNMPILAAGAKIVWADVDPVSGLISTESIKSKITDNTKAIIMVHFGGIPCDIEGINSLAKEHGIKTIEDGAHAFGSTYNGKKIGNHSDYVMFSLQAIKHITTVDGGLLFCKSKTDYQRARLLRWYGIDRDTPRKDFRCEENIIEYGYKFHMNDMNATIGLYNLPHMNDLLEKNRRNAKFFDEQLKNIEYIQLLKVNPKCNSSFWVYSIRILNGKKQNFIEKMKEFDIITSQVHNRNDVNSCVKDFKEELPNLNILEKELVCIPVGWWLEEKDLQYIVKCINKII